MNKKMLSNVKFLIKSISTTLLINEYIPNNF